MKPKDPPVFRGRAEDDVTTWTAKVQDFYYLTNASDVQQVAYAATLLQDATSDWWHSLLKTRGGMRPRNFMEFADLLGQRFGSSTRVDRARAELRTIRQGQSEMVRAYSTRFEALLGKLPSWDQDWAKSQFIWGLHGRVAELVWHAVGPRVLYAPTHAVSTLNCEIRALWQRIIVAVMRVSSVDRDPRSSREEARRRVAKTQCDASICRVRSQDLSSEFSTVVVIPLVC